MQLSTLKTLALRRRVRTKATTTFVTAFPAGHLIEAHEVFQNARYEDNPAVMNGIVGAVAQAMSGVNYHSTGARQVGDDIAAGVVTQAEREEPMALLLAMLLSQR